MTGHGTKHGTRTEHEGLRPRERRKEIPADLEDDDIDGGYDVGNQQGDDANLPDNEG